MLYFQPFSIVTNALFKLPFVFQTIYPRYPELIPKKANEIKYNYNTKSIESRKQLNGQQSEPRLRDFSGVKINFQRNARGVPRRRALLSRSSMLCYFENGKGRSEEQICRPTGASRNARSFVS